MGSNLRRGGHCRKCVHWSCMTARRNLWTPYSLSRSNIPLSRLMYRYTDGSVSGKTGTCWPFIFRVICMFSFVSANRIRGNTQIDQPLAGERSKPRQACSTCKIWPSLKPYSCLTYFNAFDQNRDWANTFSNPNEWFITGSSCRRHTRSSPVFPPFPYSILAFHSTKFAFPLIC